MTVINPMEDHQHRRKEVLTLVSIILIAVISIITSAQTGPLPAGIAATLGSPNPATGGGSNRIDCPQGSVATGTVYKDSLTCDVSDPAAAMTVDCAPLNADGTLGTPVQAYNSDDANNGRSYASQSCISINPASVAVGLYYHWNYYFAIGSYIDGFAAWCQEFKNGKLGPRFNFPESPGEYSIQSQSVCSEGRVMVGVAYNEFSCSFIYSATPICAPITAGPIVNIQSVTIRAESGDPEVLTDGTAICNAAVTPLPGGGAASVKYKFFRVQADGTRITENTGSNTRYDCTGKCKAGENIGCTAYIGNDDGSYSFIPTESSTIPISDNCMRKPLFSTITVGARTHQVLCTRKDLNTDPLKFINKECIGNDDPIGTKDIANMGEAELASATYRAKLQSSDPPTPKIPANNLIYTNAGTITIDLRPAWDGGDGLDHRFFHYAKDDNNRILIQKTNDGKIRCEYTTSGTSVNADVPLNLQSWTAGTNHFILMQWDAVNKIMRCKTDDDPAVEKSIIGITQDTLPVSTGEFVVGGALSGGVQARSNMNATIWARPSPAVSYCAQDATWTSSLDSKGKPSCEYARLKWTGTACCGEAGDKPEFYSDPIGVTPPSTIGTCWNSSYLPSGLAAPGTKERVISIAGNLIGCGLSASDPLSLLRDAHADRPLIQPAPTCTLAHDIGGNPTMNLYCSAKQNKWAETTSNKELVLSTNPTNANDKECCTKSASCWDGSKCIADQSLDSEYKPLTGYRCVRGEWTPATPKFTPDRSGRGFCPRQEDCLWNPRGSSTANYHPDTYLSTQGDLSQGPACLADGQYIMDPLCIEGNWTTRTKAIVLEMIDIAESMSPGDYALFCGDYTDVLNFIDYDPTTLGMGSVKSYIETGCARSGSTIPCVNNFCAMRLSDGRVAFGTSLNTPVNDPQSSFLKALGMDTTGCNNAAIDDGTFHECSTQTWYSRIWNAIQSAVTGQSTVQPTARSAMIYNHGLQAVIAKPTPPSASTSFAGGIQPLTSKPILKRNREPYINNPMNTLRTFTSNEARKPFQDPLANVSRFNQIFILKQGTTRNYFAFLDKDIFFDEYVDVAALSYDGITVTDPLTGKAACDLLSDRLNPSQLKRYECVYDTQNNRLRMVSISKTPASGAQATPLREFWRDMTAKLR